MEGGPGAQQGGDLNSVVAAIWGYFTFASACGTPKPICMCPSHPLISLIPFILMIDERPPSLPRSSSQASSSERTSENIAPPTARR